MLRRLLARLLRARKGAEWPPTDDMAFSGFRKAPLRYFGRYQHEPYQWPKTLGQYLDDIYIQSRTQQFGWIQLISCDDAKKEITIGHVAVDTGLVRKGLGVAVGQAFAAEVKLRYGIRSIIFAENHRNRDAAGYPAFFTRLGCQYLPPVERITIPRWKLEL